MLFLPVGQAFSQPSSEETLSRATVQSARLGLLVVTVAAGFMSSQGLGLERAPGCPPSCQPCFLTPVPVPGVGELG